MERQPFKNVCPGATWESTSHSSVSNADADSIGAIGGVEMRRVMVVIQNRDRDSKKAADYGHAAISTIYFGNRESENANQYHLNARSDFGPPPGRRPRASYQGARPSAFRSVVSSLNISHSMTE